MSEASEPPEIAEDVMLTEPVSQDPILGVLAQMAATDEFGISLTLHTPSGIVGGDLISADAWFAGQIEDNPQNPEFQKFLEGLRTALKRRREEGGDDVRYEFIHLKNVHQFTGGAPHKAFSPFWRGRISEVVGWTFGYATGFDAD